MAKNNKAKKHERELASLVAQKDEDIDLSDIPEMLNWSSSQQGRFYRPLKQSITLRIDRDVLAWFKAQGEGYQTRINQILREHIVNRRGHR